LDGELRAGVVFGPLAGVDDAAFEGGGAADEALVAFRDELVVGDLVEEVVEFPEVLVGGDPVVAHGAEVEGAGVGGESFASVVVAEVFVVVGQGQFADGLVDRVAVADDGVVGFRDGAPASVFFEQRDDVFVVEFDGLEVEEERGLAVQPERGGSEEGAFDAVGFAFAEDAPGRHVGVAVFFEIDREAVEEVLDFARAGQLAQDGGLAGVQAEHGGENSGLSVDAKGEEEKVASSRRAPKMPDSSFWLSARGAVMSCRTMGRGLFCSRPELPR
jgi:hypothetical protein